MVSRVVTPLVVEAMNEVMDTGGQKQEEQTG